MSSRYYKYSYATNVSRPYKQQGNQGQNQATPPTRPEDKGKTLAQRVADCKARVQTHIVRVNADTTIPATVKTAMLQKLAQKAAECSTPHGLGKEENDKEHKDVDNIRKGQGQLVRQITPGALRKNPTVLESLIKAIQDFFKNIQNRPEVVDRFLAKYPPAPITAPTT